MPAVVYLYALTFILQFCFAMFFVPPRLKIVAKTGNNEKTPALKYHWYFF
jgi:hypothetical protein